MDTVTSVGISTFHVHSWQYGSFQTFHILALRDWPLERLLGPMADRCASTDSLLRLLPKAAEVPPYAVGFESRIDIHAKTAFRLCSAILGLLQPPDGIVAFSTSAGPYWATVCWTVELDESGTSNRL